MGYYQGLGYYRPSYYRSKNCLYNVYVYGTLYSGLKNIFFLLALFQFLTLLALHIFVGERVDVAVVEVRFFPPSIEKYLKII